MSRQMIMQMIVGCSRFVCVFVFENTYWPVLRRGIVSIGVCVEVYGQQWAKRADPGCFIFYNSSFILSLSNCSGACAAEVSQHLSAVWILWFSFRSYFSLLSLDLRRSLCPAFSISLIVFMSSFPFVPSLLSHAHVSCYLWKYLWGFDCIWKRRGAIQFVHTGNQQKLLITTTTTKG